MKRAVALVLVAAVVVPGASVLAPAQAFAQSNDNDYTPLNSRIRRDRQFPTEPRSTFAPRQLSDASRQRSRNMADSFAGCIWDRSNEKGRDFLSRSDLGLVSFEQMGIDRSRITQLYPIQTCLQRVAMNNSSGVRLSYTADAMRRWYLQAAYLDTYRDGPSWVVPGYTTQERVLPLSANNPMIRAVLDFADCVVSMDPHAADYFYRTGMESAEEDVAIQYLTPLMSECLPEGQTFTLSPPLLRIWVGEALWHAASNSVPMTTQEPVPAQPVQGNP